MYDISSHITIENKLGNKITKAVLRERLIETLQSLGAETSLSDEDGAVEFKPVPRNRGRHPLKNITFGRIGLAIENNASSYVTTVSFQLSLVQMRISLITITVAMCGYGLLRGYTIALLLALTILFWLAGYVLTLLSIRARFRSFIETIAQ